jgi:putative Mg2+ transporter-C (MgtC) family protein
MIATVSVLIVLLLFPRLERWIDKIRESRSYRIIISTSNMEKLDHIENALKSHHLYVYDHHQSKSGETIMGTWHTMGKPVNHEQFILEMMKDHDIREFVY